MTAITFHPEPPPEDSEVKGYPVCWLDVGGRNYRTGLYIVTENLDGTGARHYILGDDWDGWTDVSDQIAPGEVPNYDQWAWVDSGSPGTDT